MTWMICGKRRRLNPVIVKVLEAFGYGILAALVYFAICALLV